MKYAFIALAIMGLFWLANRFPGLQGHAFSAGPIAVSYVLLGAVVVAIVGMKAVK